ncbi:MAG: AAA family ATPase, partial [Anaerolineales bacterium]
MSRELRSDEVWKACDPRGFSFVSTADLHPEPRVIGQPRGLRAIELGIAMDSPGYNIYVLGDPGTGRTTAAQAYIEGRARQLPVPPEWVYLFNFADPHRPRALKLMPGKAGRLRQGMDQLVEDLQKALPRALESDAFRQAAQRIRESLDTQREQELGRLQSLGREKGAAVVPSPEGLQILPAREGRPLTPEEFAALGEPEKQAWRENSFAVQRELDEALRRVRHVEANAQRDLAEMVRRAAAAVVDRELDDLRTAFSDQTDALDYLNQVRSDILDNVELFRAQGEAGPEAGGPARLMGMPPAGDPLRRYRVNILVDHAAAHGAPVIVERHPSVPRLLGRIEHETRFGGGVSTDFTLIRPGALHRANGGFLILWARDLFAEPGAWDALERALAGEQFAPDDPAARSGAPTSSLHPEPVPLDLKVVLIGSPSLYYFLVEADEDFRSIFKVMADFDETMERTPESELAYAEFIAGRCQAEGLLPLAPEGVSRVVEEGSRLAGTQRKLSTRFGTIADLVREADHWARSAGRKV